MINPGDQGPARKLSRIVDNDETPFVHARTYRAPLQSDATPRIAAGAANDGTSIFRSLVGCLRPPYLLLYVLHTPRGETTTGRYQSPPISAEELDALLQRFEDFFRADARFDLWAHSPEDEATVIWDRHDLLYAYGPHDRYIDALEAQRYVPGNPAVPFPHAHHYRAAFDADAQALIAAFDWRHSPLRPEDQQ